MLGIETPLGIDIFQILQYGISGLAVVLLFFGYRLLNQLLNLQGDDKSFKSKLTSVIIFMATSLIFFFGGIFGQRMSNQSENPINIIILPDSMPSNVGLPSLRKGKDLLSLTNNAVTVKVKPDATITVGLDCLTTKIQELTKTIANAPAINSTLKTE